MKWTCNSRVDYVDEEMLQLMAKAGSWLISWGIESGSEQSFKTCSQRGLSGQSQTCAHLGTGRQGLKIGDISLLGCPERPKKRFSKRSDLPKRLPLDIALFHVAAPYPGTPFFFEVVKERLVPARHPLGASRYG